MYHGERILNQHHVWYTWNRGLQTSRYAICLCQHSSPALIHHVHVQAPSALSLTHLPLLPLVSSGPLNTSPVPAHHFFCSPFIVSTPLHHLILTKICEEGWETQIIVPIFQMRNRGCKSFSLALLNSAKVVPCWYIHILEME